MPSMPKKLNLGCGEDKKVGYINVDWSSLVSPDVAHDLNKVPYPFEDSSIDRIEAFNVLEHLEKPFVLMKEFHRILKRGGELNIKVPHFSRGFTHAEHEHGFDVTLPLYFYKRFSHSGYFGVDFELQKMQLHWLAWFHFLPLMGYGVLSIKMLRLANACISGIANISPSFASRIWCFWVGGFDEIEFVFRKS